MTTDRTAIRRRLAVRRTAHRPPWRGRKAWHRSIVAPLGATLAASLAATVAVGVGAALARAERDRRSATDRRRARAQARAASRRAARRGPATHGPRPGRPRDRAARWRRRRTGCGAGGPRDAQGAQAPARAAAAAGGRARRTDARPRGGGAASDRRAPVGRARRRGDGGDARRADRAPPAQARAARASRRLRERLVAERERGGRSDPRRGHPRARRSPSCAARARGSRWTLPHREGIRAIEAWPANASTAGDASAIAGPPAARAIGAQTMHEWRKRVKDLRYAAEMLSPAEAAGKRGKASAGKRGKASAGKGARSLRRWPSGRTSSENCSARTTTWSCSPNGSARTASAGPAHTR